VIECENDLTAEECEEKAAGREFTWDEDKQC
jgi:hypothetical protein